MADSVCPTINIDQNEFIYDHETPGDTSLFGSTLILLNTAIGSGTLLIPYCYKSGIFIATLISIIFGLLSFSTIILLIDSSFLAKKYEYSDLFIYHFGRKNKWILNTMIFLVQFGTTMIYSHWNGRFLNQIFRFKIIVLNSNIFWIFISTLLIAFPLTIFKEISALEKFTWVSTFFILILIIHALFWFIKDAVDYGFDPNNELKFFNYERYDIIFTAFSVNSFAYNCHINLFSCLNHLTDCTFKRSYLLCGITIILAFLLYSLFGLFSYLNLFDSIGEGSSLEFYNKSSKWFTYLTMGGVIIVLEISTPLIVWGARNSFDSLFWNGKPMSTIRWISIGFGICLLAAALSSASDNIIMFFNVVGGLFTPLIIYLFPALFYIKSGIKTKKYKIIIAYFTSCFSIVITIACTYQAIQDIIKSFK